ncbi:UvrD-helicase domain-containing protein [Rhodanobacter hydrolyticus]|uniref:DNA 3'-5' helicase II n=1 Tax=Rhodanobacter hydrolyticus TaxID=2250595 RepID=A0ABW8J497_9GAMM
MSKVAFSGGAGCGKTHQLMQRLSEYLVATPLAPHQRILALTFMHGSRRRLDERLIGVLGLQRRYECATLDSLAWRIVRRWQALVAHQGKKLPEASDYEAICDTAAELLNQSHVSQWVAATYPALVLDEAQDLTPNRLAVIIALCQHMHLLAAADEFQCLNETLRPNPAWEWLRAEAEIVELDQPQRTKIQELLNASAALRGGQALISDRIFKVQLTAQAALAGTYLANELAWNGKGQRIAVITPTIGKFANDVITWVGNNKTKQGNGPYQIPWEKAEDKLSEELLAKLELPDVASSTAIIAALEAIGDILLKRDITQWLNLQRRTLGRTEFLRHQVVEAITLSISHRRRQGRGDRTRIKAMSIHGAKNREFDQVIVLWPAAVRGDADQLRRLLYNAVTRAKAKCLVLVQAQAALNRPPFK